MKLLILFILSVLIIPSGTFAYSIKGSNNKYTYQVDYYESAIKTVDEKIREWLDSELEEFKQYENYNNIKNDFYTTYELYTYKNITFLQYSISSYTGGAHYGLKTRQFTYDDQGNFLELKNFFNNTNYLAIISSLSYNELVKLNINEDLNWLKEGTKPIEDNFSLYYLDEQGLHLTFPPYQVAPWASGIIKITIPITKLSKWLKPVDNF